MRLPLALLALAGSLTCGGDATAPPDDGGGAALQLGLRRVVSGLSSPVHLTAPAGDPRLFVVEQGGRIRVVKGGRLLDTPFLDVSSRIASGGERGLLSVAFAPDYATSGAFFIYYTAPNGDVTIERRHAAPAADIADASASTVITVPHSQYSNHNGGLVAFGPDGMLYAGIGDGGSGGDPNGNGQNTNVLLGKLIRIDVRTAPYAIPADNPFAGQAGKRGEIWAYGLRNPWRWSFDAPAGAADARLFIADVGQNAYEEVDVAPASVAGANYGWSVMEGLHCYRPSSGCAQDGLRLPVHEYDHSSGDCSITGGHVYRGAAIPELRGQYLFSDYCGGWLASLTSTGTGAAERWTAHRWPVPRVGSVLSFGRDASGELYMLGSSGDIWKIVKR